MKIHPSAIVSPQAVLADDVEIGPQAIIGDHVTIGAGSVVLARAIIEGYTTLGSGNTIGYGTIIGAPPQDFAFDPATRTDVIIGDGNTFREYVTIHRGTKAGSATVVGDGCYLMVGAHLGHNVTLGNKVIIANNCALGGYVEVHDQAILGGGTVFHQFMRIGKMAMVRGGTRFGQDIPPYAMGDEDNILAGINAIGLRRSGVPAETRLEIKRVYRELFRSGLNISQGIAKIKESSWSPMVQEFIAFIESSKRGICRMHQAKGERGKDEDGD